MVTRQGLLISFQESFKTLCGFGPEDLQNYRPKLTDNVIFHDGYFLLPESEHEHCEHAKTSFYGTDALAFGNIAFSGKVPLMHIVIQFLG